MVDFHSHILPGIDDGSRNAEQTEEMLREMKKQNIDVVVATPHFDMRLENIENFLARRKAAESKLPKDVPGFPEIVIGAEVFCCGIDLSKIEDIDKLCIGNSRYMLVETYFHKLDDEFANSMRKLMFERNITPVLAHTERYYFIEKNGLLIRQLSSEGMVLQMNAEAFIKFSTRSKAFKLFKKENIGVLGSDCHNMQKRPPNMNEAIEIIKKKAGSERLKFIENNSLKMLGI